MGPCYGAVLWGRAMGLCCRAGAVLWGWAVGGGCTMGPCCGTVPYRHPIMPCVGATCGCPHGGGEGGSAAALWGWHCGANMATGGTAALWGPMGALGGGVPYGVPYGGAGGWGAL